MKLRRYYIVLLCLILGCTFNVEGQSRKTKKAEKKALSKGDEEYEYNKFGLALPFYIEAASHNPDNALTWYKIGRCYLDSKERKKSLEGFERANEIDPNIHPELFYNLGQSYHLHERFDEAIAMFNKYKSITTDPVSLADADRQILECNVAVELIANPVDVVIENVGPVINSKYSDYAPVLSADESVLIFTSRREGSTGGEPDETGEYYEDLYISKKVDGSWTSPENMKEINTEDHEASVGLSPDGTKLLIYTSDGKGDVLYCKQNKDGTWIKPKKFPKAISDKNTYENSASISADKQVLYFASDRAGGYGGTDIWVARLNSKGEWDNPQNLGPVINTSGNEESPFIDVDAKTLYFSSNFHRGMGLFDIYKSEFNPESSSWSEPANLGYPINTVEDDIYFVLAGDAKHAYFNSVKDGGYGGEDIYRIRMPEREDLDERIALVEEATGRDFVAEEIEPEPEPEPVVEIEPEPEPEPEPVVMLGTIVNGVVREKDTDEPLEGAAVELIDTKSKVVKVAFTDSRGAFSLHVPMEVEGQLSVTGSFSKHLHQTRHIAVLSPSEMEKVIDVELWLESPHINSRIILRNIYFDFDQHTLKKESYVELNKLVQLLKENDHMKANVESHTDHIGSHAYNVRLSEQRSEAVVEYLESQGVHNHRVIPVGLGEEKPLASNDDEFEGRELNRRTEFVVIGL